MKVKMKKSILMAVVVLLCSVLARADYLSDRKAALVQVQAGKDAEALAMFVKMAEGPYTDFQKSDALGQAAWCAWRLKQNDRAMELSKRIPLAPASKTMQMRIMDVARNWNGIVDAFKNEDIDSWPEDVVGDAFFLRGIAYYRTGNGKGAEADIIKTLEYKPSAYAMHMLGSTYASMLKDDGRALETYRRGYKSGGHWSTDAVWEVLQILLRQNKFDEALAELNAVDADKDALKEGDSHWRRGFILSSQGYILAKQGKKAESIAKYREATQVEGLTPEQKAGYEKTIKELEADVK